MMQHEEDLGTWASGKVTATALRGRVLDMCGCVSVRANERGFFYQHRHSDMRWPDNVKVQNLNP